VASLDQSKKSLTEQDIRTKYITPAIVGAGWDLHTQIREEKYFTAGRVNVRGKTTFRAPGKKADYILYYKPNIPIAVIEAKDNNHSVEAGIQQAIEYGEILDIPFVYSSNGDAFLERDPTMVSGNLEQEIPLDRFPSPGELWRRYQQLKNITPDENQIIAQDYFSDAAGKEPRYYQQIAINRATEAIAKGQNRLLLVMATGTGKTFTAFQIIWRLWKARTKKRILFLADRNILVDQTRVNDFKPFGGAMTKITKRQIDKSYEIYLALYQAVSGTEEERNIYRQFSPDFFDLVIVDECHRGSAAEDSAWREVLEYFSSATQIGMTATPKETEDVSNIDYFGDPFYTYSLKQGIEDGFLAPYKVVRIDIDKDVEGWRPPEGKVDRHGQLIEDRIYNQSDMDRKLVLEQRTQLVARKVAAFLRDTNPYSKTIVFCEDIDHARRMRTALVNASPDHAAENSKYVMNITGDDPQGKMELDSFIEPESIYPVIVTTSKLLSTGVDTQTCELIVLDQTIKSMTLFKQIIGRGTRIREDYGKLFFTIMDFKKATELFADPDFDGDPVQIYEPKDGESPVPPDDVHDAPEIPEGDPPFPLDDRPPPDGPDFPLPPVPQRKYYVDDVAVAVVGERVQYYGNDGNLITESLRDYTRKSVGKEYASLEVFLKTWTDAEQKTAIIMEMEQQGILIEALAYEVGGDYDPFDLVCHVAWDQPPLTRRERADNVRKRNYFTKYGDQARAVMEALLDKYADEGILPIEDMNVLNVQPLSTLGTPVELVAAFGGRDEYLAAVKELEHHLYAA